MKITYYKNNRRVTKKVARNTPKTKRKPTRAQKQYYTRKTVAKYKFEAAMLTAAILAFGWLCTAFNNDILRRSNVELVEQVQAMEQKEISIAESISQTNNQLVKTIEARNETIEQAKKREINLIISWYNPALGGTNCAIFEDGECVSKMANGQRWQDHVGTAIACPRELEFGTKIMIEGRVFECMDRGGAIKKIGNEYWIDMLLEQPLYDYGTRMKGQIL